MIYGSDSYQLEKCLFLDRIRKEYFFDEDTSMKCQQLVKVFPQHSLLTYQSQTLVFDP